MSQPPPGSKPNGASQLLTLLAQSGDKWIQFGVLVLVGISGIGNWAATWNSSDRNKQEIEMSRRVAWESNERIRQEVIKQVADIHEWMKEATDEFHKGNKDSATNRQTLDEFKSELAGFEKRQMAVLSNQTSIMNSQTAILEKLHGFVKERQEELHKNEQ